MINHQFSPELIRDRSRWKTQEIWPNNRELKQLPGRKLFLVCNPFWGDYNRSISNDTFKIFLYADLHLQLRLAWEKQAWWFTDETRRCTNAPDNNQVYLRQIIKDAGTFNEQPVDPAVPKIIQEYSPDQIINLKEFAHGKNIIDPPNTHQLKFLDHWIRHNDDHAGTYRGWAEKARENHLDGAADLLNEAARMTIAISSRFEAALAALTPQKPS